MAGFVGASLLKGYPLLGKWRPDVMHVHFAVPAGAAGWLLNRLSGVPYVLTAHLGDVPGGVPEKTGKWFRLIFPLTPPIWRDAAAVTAHMRERHITLTSAGDTEWGGYCDH